MSADPGSESDPEVLDPEVLEDPLDSADDPDSGTSSTQSKVLAPTGGSSLVSADPFRRYMAEVSRYAPLGREEERQLARVYRETASLSRETRVRHAVC